jgi:type IV pilus assembly protein PilE
MKRKQHGMTLIELMIVVAIVAILASIAIPAYGRYVMRANRVDGTAALLRLAAAQERFYLQNNTYTDTIGDLGISGTENNFYALTITDADTGGFTAEAAAQGRQADDDDCQKFFINQLGQRTSVDGGDADSTATCWRR